MMMKKNVEMFVCYFENNPAKLKYIHVLAFSKYLFLIGKLQILNSKIKVPTNYMRLSQHSMSTFSGNSKVTWIWLVQDLLHTIKGCHFMYFESYITWVAVKYNLFAYTKENKLKIAQSSFIQLKESLFLLQSLLWRT